MLPTVHIRREAFEGMIISVVEAFKKESYGYLFGSEPTQSQNRFLITHIMPLQFVHRFNISAETYQRSERRLKDLFLKLPKKSCPIGSFHSHTEWGDLIASPEMSDEDIKDMKREGHEIEILILISSRKKATAPWESQTDGNIKGSLGKYNFNINAYSLEDKEPVRLKIVAPVALKALNRVLGYQI